MIPTSNTSCSTPPSCAPTSTRPAQKGAQNQAIGRSRGGLSTKLHIAVDALGNPLRIRLTPGQAHDITQAEALVSGLPAEILIADKAFDADAFRAHLSAHDIHAVIPSNRSRAQAIAHDPELYKERHLVECFINKIKHFRRIATRYDKTAQAFMSMICIACMMVWLR